MVKVTMLALALLLATVTVSSVTPSSGKSGDTITVTGSGFTPNSDVLLGTMPMRITFVSSTELKAKVPTVRAAKYEVKVCNGPGQPCVIVKDAFEYK
jgi:hypothetical protein